MGKTSIEWTDHSINPIRARNTKTGAVGHYCEKISSGCANCYASNLQNRFQMPGFPGAKSLVDWAEPPIGYVQPFLDEKQLNKVLSRKKPTKYFWCDMTDLFGRWVPDAWIDECLAVMALTPQHTHQILTKRPERAAEMLTTSPRHNGGLIIQTAFEMQKIRGGVQDSRMWPEPEWPLQNAWIGTSVENQAQADKRIPELLKIPAAVRFLSCEPLLGPVDLLRVDAAGFGGNKGHKIDCIRKGFWSDNMGFVNHCDMHDIFGDLHWVIVGGESGPGSRPCSIDWIRSLRDQCQEASVPFFNKQLGARPFMPGSGGERFDWPCGYEVRNMTTWFDLKDKKGGDWNEWPEDLRVREFPVTKGVTPSTNGKTGGQQT